MAGGKRLNATRHEGFLAHGRYRWLWVACAVAATAVAAYGKMDNHGRPAGNTTFGYVSGTVGALLIVWLTALGMRKRLFNGRGALKGWVSAHVYLGLALVVIAGLHTGLRFGWNVHTLAFVLMIGVVVSGVWGVIAYATLPRLMSINRAEMTEAQMLERLRRLDARLNDAAQGLTNEDAAIVRLSLNETRLGGRLFARLGFGVRALRQSQGAGRRRQRSQRRPRHRGAATGEAARAHPDAAPYPVTHPARSLAAVSCARDPGSARRPRRPHRQRLLLLVTGR